MARKILVLEIIFIFLFLLCPKAYCATIDDVIKANPQFHSAVIGISVKDANSGAVVYQKNSHTLLHPASTLKIVTSAPALDYLGEKYNFYTRIYKNGQNTHLKLSADPLFTYADMQNLIAQYKSRNNGLIKTIIIEDTIIDKIPYGLGWQWDDNTNIHFPQISPYVINDNIFLVKAKINDKNDVVLENAVEYSEPIINNLKLGEKNSIKIERNIFDENQSITLNGTIKETKIIKIPALNPQKLFNNVLCYVFIQNQIPFYSNFKYAKTPRFSPIEAEISHSIIEVLDEINQNSNNLAAEILVKHVGAIKTESTGTTEDGLMVVKDFYARNGVNLKNIILVDASGASMNDYVTADFMTNALKAIKNSSNFLAINNSMSTPAKGTFKGRIPELNGSIQVKTGTLANTSAVVGYLKTKSGRDLVFAIMLDNLPKNVKAKEFENSLIKVIAEL